MQNKIKDNIFILIKLYWLHIVNIVAFLGIFGSLYYSEVKSLTPCDLCWYGRVFLYPIALISFVAIVKKQKEFFQYILVLAFPGMFISGYQYLLQKTNWFSDIGLCDPSNPCSKKDIEYLGFITIPLMAFVAFFFISALTIIAWYLDRKESKV